MEFVYRVLICSLPFLFSLAGYYFLGKKILKCPRPVWKVLSAILAIAGIAFTLYQSVVTFSNLGDGSFNFLVLIANVIIMALISIFLAFAEPEV